MSLPLTSADLVGVDLAAADRDDATRQLIALLAALTSPCPSLPEAIAHHCYQ